MINVCDKDDIRHMRKNGWTLDDIGKEYGVSRQRIHQLTKDMHLRGQRAPDYETMIYPNLVKWLRDNRYTCNRFAKQIGTTYTTFYRWMTGKCNPSKSSIDTILEETGMSYEVAFAEGVIQSEPVGA